MDNNDTSKKEKGFLSRVFGKTAARKVVLGTLLVAGLMGGVSGQAMAQSANGYASGMTPYTIQVQPWSNDQTYQVKLQNIEAQSALRLERLKASEQAKEASANKWHAQQLDKMYKYIRSSKKNFANMAKVGASGADVEARYRKAIVDDRAAYQSAVLKEQAYLIRQIQSLDASYARLPQYRGVTYNTNGYQPAVQKVTSAVPAAGQALTPQQQHDRLVRAYQDAQLSAAKQGKPMPKPENYGLKATDPALR
jgi:hypothetical protein